MTAKNVKSHVFLYEKYTIPLERSQKIIYKTINRLVRDFQADFELKMVKLGKMGTNYSSIINWSFPHF